MTRYMLCLGEMEGIMEMKDGCRKDASPCR